jgi:magnesium transporter
VAEVQLVNERSFETVGALAVAEIPRAAAGSTAGDVRASLSGRRFDSAVEVAVLDRDGRLAGVVPIERLLQAAGTERVESLAVDVPTVTPDTDAEIAARRAARAGRSTVAVVGAGGLFHGLVPAERLLGVLELEHEEDLARHGGYRAGATMARTAAEEAVPQRLWHRLPWLLIGLLGAMASAGIVGAFEEKIREVVLLALFVPAVVYMADAVGTQTEAVVIRGMSVGVSLRGIVGRELITGLVVGVLIGAAFFPFAYAVWGDEAVAATVSIALVVSCAVATVVAMALPYSIARFGGDPAFGAGPLATVIQDLLSILAYFAVALLLT